ncbi:hypothetical protein N44_03935 [Microcystis aeruginosa NIES-44]|uniref:Uncharacterized protein n=1 Tax=Microcystis aeruginosa NIES-44 TaxID=449439 RepID=A0A0A1VZA9_MICAE|nr:hypothetical protein N44_03935 [Microcystis aeruginosa NIES-44]
MPIAYCLLPIAYCLLPILICSLYSTDLVSLGYFNRSKIHSLI